MRKKIAIIAGGDSGEYEVSISSAGVVEKNLDRSLYEPYIIIIKGMNWYHERRGKKYQVDKNYFSLILDKNKIKFDCVFNAIHGTPGEDGKLQGYFEMFSIPYTSSDWITSALIFNKEFCKTIVKSYGIKIPKSFFIKKNANIDLKIIKEKIGMPCFVKPNKGGSSVGITRVMDKNNLKDAIDKAFKEDNEILVEEFIHGTEITCGVLTHKGNIIVLPITEIVSKKDFFDYDAKYKGMADEITPARISVEVEKKCKSLSAFLYNNLNCKGVVRFDYIFNEEGMYFLEANTVPGLSEASIVPQQANDMGISITELFSMIIEETIMEK